MSTGKMDFCGYLFPPIVFLSQQKQQSKAFPHMEPDTALVQKPALKINTVKSWSW